MARKVMGPRGSRRRRWLFLCTALAAIAIAVLIIPSAFAVHDEGVYQLDGNAQVTDNTETPTMPSALEDADNICAAQYAATGPSSDNLRGQFCHPASGVTLPAASSSTRTAFVTDGSGPYASSQGNVDDQYTGGSGDAQDLSAWLYKNAASSNDKSDIQNAFAAQYTVNSTECPTPKDAAHLGCNVGDKVIYFGGDRTSDSGDENTAFWFLQSPAVESPNGACTNSNGCPFTTDGKSLANGGTLAHHVAANPGPDHCLFNPANPNLSIYFPTGGACPQSVLTSEPDGDTYGDILVVSAFTGGGVEPNVTAYEWIGANSGYGSAKGADTSKCGTTTCTTIKILSVNKGCNATDSGDPACAITNQAAQTGIVGQPQPIQAPWAYTEKVGDNGQSGANTCTTAPGKMCPSIYFEGGINLSALGLQSECTSTFVMDTRSSQSVSSSLQDLAVGQVGSCTTTLSTKAGDTTDVPENGGLAATHASPTSIGTGTVSSGTDTAAIQVSGASSYSGTITWFICGPFASEPAAPKCDTTHGVPAGSATVSETNENTHYFVSGTANLTSHGVYCWTAHFTPSSGTNSQITAKDDNGANECFNVASVTPTLTTAAVSPTGGLSPTIIGGKADLNGDGAITSADSWTAFYGDTSIISGQLDCDAWGTTANAGLAGDGTITAHGSPGADDCTLIGYDGTSDGVTITVEGGKFTKMDGNAIPDGTPLPTVFNAASPNNNSVAAADFAWSTIYGRVDSNGNGSIDDQDCTFNAVGGASILGHDASCGNGTPIPSSLNGLVDKNADGQITSADSCTNGCFLGHNLSLGRVLAGTVDFGSAIYDVATLNGTATQPGTNGGRTTSPSGTVNPCTSLVPCYPSINANDGAAAGTSITFTLRGPNNCTATPASGLTSGTNGQVISVTGDGDYTTAAVVPNTPGVYHWSAVYTPDGGGNTLGTDHNLLCTDAGEDVTIRQIPTSIKTKQDWIPNDTATVTASTGNLVAGGSVRFRLFDNSSCSGTALYDESVSVPGGSTSAEVHTSNTGSGSGMLDITTGYGDAADSTKGPYSWLVEYTPASGDTAHLASSSACNAEHFSTKYTNDAGP
jgi:hypothetical protein